MEEPKTQDAVLWKIPGSRIWGDDVLGHLPGRCGTTRPLNLVALQAMAGMASRY